MSWLRCALWIGGLALVLVVGSSLIAGLVELMGWAVKEQKSVEEIFAPRSGGLSDEAYFLIPAAVIGAPIAEELVFRGLLFRRLALTVPSWLAYAASALAFAAIHGNPSGLPIYILQGLLFAAVYAKTGRLSAAIAVHFLNNLITVALALS